MNKLFFALALLFVGMSANAQHLGTEYRLKRVIPVAGRQGIAIDSNYYYVSDTKVLYIVMTIITLRLERKEQSFLWETK